MLCCDTGSHPSVRYENLDVRTVKRHNKLVGILKSFFRGDGKITFAYSGGKVSRVWLETVDSDEEKK
jgi:hypothetical protein